VVVSPSDVVVDRSVVGGAVVVVGTGEHGGRLSGNTSPLLIVTASGCGPRS
jgi:hypothetical protein